MKRERRKAKKMPKTTIVQRAATSASITVPDEVAAWVEDEFTKLSSTPNSYAHLVFGAVSDEDDNPVYRTNGDGEWLTDEDGNAIPEMEDADLWLAQARTYCKTRQPRALRFRILPAKGLPENEYRIQITDDLQENGARRGVRAH